MTVGACQYGGIVARLERLNSVLTGHLLRETRGKRVLLDVTGGHDTRVNLSVLVRHGVEFEAFTYDLSHGDVKIASKICEELGVTHHVTTREKAAGYRDSLEYDVNVCGVGYSEWMCVLHKLNKSIRQIQRHNRAYVDRLGRDGSRYSPMVESDVVEVIKDIPLVYLAGGYIQKRLIGMNHPGLLRFPFTYYDFRHLLLNSFHRRLVDLVYRSYYRGVCNNPYEDKGLKE